MLKHSMKKNSVWNVDEISKVSKYHHHISPVISKSIRFIRYKCQREAFFVINDGEYVETSSV